MASKLTDRDDVPAMAPPAGSETDFSNPAESIQTLVIAVLSTCMLLSTVCAVLRVGAVYSMDKRLTWVDLNVGIAWISHAVFDGMLFAALPDGAGHHMWDVPESKFKKIQFLLYVSFIMYDVAIASAKIAILLQLSAIFASKTRNCFYWCSLACMMINAGFYLALSVALICQCNPISKAWTPSLPGRCLDQDALLTSSGPFNIISDAIMVVLPINAVFRLNLNKRSRVEVMAMFAVAIFGCMCSAVRLSYTDRLKETGDETWLIMQNQLWANAEITVAILIASTFVLPRFLQSQGWLRRSRRRVVHGIVADQNLLSPSASPGRPAVNDMSAGESSAGQVSPSSQGPVLGLNPTVTKISGGRKMGDRKQIDLSFPMSVDHAPLRREIESVSEHGSGYNESTGPIFLTTLFEQTEEHMALGATKEFKRDEIFKFGTAL